MIRVCDAIMGTGKSQSAITYMNEHSDKRFVYITPYLEEADRIKAGCPTLKFVAPSNKLEKYGFSKSKHTAALIEQGKNVTTTHQAFKFYTKDTLARIREMGYTLFIDENVDVLMSFDFSVGDLELAVNGGYVKESNGTYTRTDKEYTGTALSEFFRLLQSRDLVRVNGGLSDELFFWTLPPDLITSFDDVFILTYLFSGQSLHHFMEIYNIPYEYIGIAKYDGGFRFCEYPGYTPEYVYNLRDMLRIVQNDKLNSVGDNYYALSMNWFNRSGGERVDELKRSVYNCMRNIWADIPADKKMWGSYNGEFSKLKGKGYTKSFVTFNAKATNKYRDRKCLVYVSNLFMNVNEKKFYEMYGIKVDEDMYALSIMVQWIWRSAIRDGECVNLYIPSKRMRGILEKWIDSVSEGGGQRGNVRQQ